MSDIIKRKKIDRKRFGVGVLHECFSNAKRVLLEHGKQDANLRYVEGHIGSGIEHAWLEDVKSGTIYEVTIPEFYEVREYKDGVPQEWKKCKTVDNPAWYIADRKLSFAEIRTDGNGLRSYLTGDQVRVFKKKLTDHQLRLLKTMCENYENDPDFTAADWRIACRAEFGFEIYPPVPLTRIAHEFLTSARARSVRRRRRSLRI